MAKNLIICFVLWIVVAVIAEHTAVAENNTTTVAPINTTDSATTGASNATAPPSNTTDSATTAASNATAAPSNTTATTMAPCNTTAIGTTAPPSTTTAPGTTAASNTTAPPSNTTAPGTTAASNATAPPSNTTAPGTTAASNTTAPPSNTTAPGTTAAPSNTTATGNSTVPGTTSAPTPTPVTTAAPTPAPDPCKNNTCGRGSTCEARAGQTFICLCLPGDYYNNVTKRCETAKVFPGLLQLPQIVYEDTMSDKASPAFKRAADNITEELFKSLKPLDSNYRGCIVLALVPVSSTRLRATQHVNASVELIYSAESTVTTSQVQEMVKTATNCTDCSLAGASFAEEDLCQRKACDEVTTSCSSANGIFSCTCQPDYVPSNHSTRTCVACPSGQQADNSVCVKCSFGHSGFNCNENWLFILVIVGSVLGGLLLIALILLIIVSVRSPKKSSKRQMPDIGSPYMSHSPAKGPLGNGSSVHGQAASVNGSAASSAAFANAGLPRFPRATANNSYDNRGNLEMIHGNSRQNLIPTDMNSQLDDNQYDTNPYAQGRGQNNPYARSQGQTNHYYN